jgi:hypothetical protein
MAETMTASAWLVWNMQFDATAGPGRTVTMDAIAEHGRANLGFRPRVQRRDFEWLTSKLALDAKPHHNFPVFEVYLRAGLMNDARTAVAVKTIDSCRIRWRRVVSVDGLQLVVARWPFHVVNVKLALADEEIVLVTCQIEERSFADYAGPMTICPSTGNGSVSD